MPTCWELVLTEGTPRTGYVQLAEGAAVRLEVRWQKATPNRPLREIADGYVRKLQKKARKEGLEVAVERSLKLASPPQKQTECYRWHADRQGLAMLSRCSNCERRVHLHLMGEREESLKSLARTIFGSLQDHAEQDGHLWSFLDVEFRSPRGFALSRTALKSGCIRMRFRRGRTKLEVVRVSLAEVLLADSDLDQWLSEFYADRLKRRSYHLKEATVRGHAGVQLQGRPWLLVNPGRLIGRRKLIRARCWHCPESNRIFICALDGRAGDAELLPAVVQSVKCCQTD